MSASRAQVSSKIRRVSFVDGCPGRREHETGVHARLELYAIDSGRWRARMNVMVSRYWAEVCHTMGFFREL